MKVDYATVGLFNRSKPRWSSAESKWHHHGPPDAQFCWRERRGVGDSCRSWKDKSSRARSSRTDAGGELLPQDEISFDFDVYLLLPKRAQELKSGVQTVEVVPEPTETNMGGVDASAGQLFEPTKGRAVAVAVRERTLTIRGEIPTEVWNRLGRTLIPKLKTRNELAMKLDFSVQIESETARGFQQELVQLLRELNLADTAKVEIE